MVKVDEIFFQFPPKRIRTGVMIFKTTVNHLDDVVPRTKSWAIALTQKTADEMGDPTAAFRN